LQSLLPTAGDDHLVAESTKRLREPSPDARTAARNQNRIPIYLHVFLPDSDRMMDANHWEAGT